jgi:hypothetical protein
LQLDLHGAELHSGEMSRDELAALRTLADTTLMGRPGVRLTSHEMLTDVLESDGRVGRLAVAFLGEGAQPVRATMFDKTAENNWSVAWHQDRAIAVRAQHDTPGFGPWSAKAGVIHVEPPFELITKMITIRAHLDDSDLDNAPLLIVPGSHRLGRVPAKQAAEIAVRLGQASCIASAGDIWVYATAIVHASHRARIPRRRRVLQVDYSSARLPVGLQWLGLAR